MHKFRALLHAGVIAMLALPGVTAGPAPGAAPPEPTGYALGTQFADNVLATLGDDGVSPEDFLQGVRDTLADNRYRMDTGAMSVLLHGYSQQRQQGKQRTADADLSYALGVSLSRDMALDRTELALDAFIEGAGDVLHRRELRYSEAKILELVEDYFRRWMERRRHQAERNLARGREYLERNRRRQGVQELDNGLQYEILQRGDGAKPTAASRVRVHYRGTDIDGQEFDSSRRNNAPAIFSVQGVIRGWQQILPLMRTGARWRIYVPPKLAYGERGSPPSIGPNQTLVFDIELLEIL